MLSFSLRRRLGGFDLDLALDVPDGPMLLVGPSGAGKTQTLLTVLGLKTPRAGTVRLGDEVLFDSEAGADVPPEARQIAYIPQQYGLFPHLTVLENVLFAVRSRAGRPERERQAQSHLERVGVGHLARELPRWLSGGEQQRVALARAMAAQPRAMLLDEPFAALDAPNRRLVRTALRDELARLAIPALVVSHDLQDALELGAPLAVLERGRVVQVGTAEELARAPATEFVAELTAPR